MKLNNFFIFGIFLFLFLIPFVQASDLSLFVEWKDSQEPTKEVSQGEKAIIKVIAYGLNYYDLHLTLIKDNEIKKKFTLIKDWKGNYIIEFEIETKELMGDYQVLVEAFSAKDHQFKILNLKVKEVPSKAKNQPPEIKKIEGPKEIKEGETLILKVMAEDPDNGKLAYFVSPSDLGKLENSGLLTWGIPYDFVPHTDKDLKREIKFTFTVQDKQKAKDSKEILVIVKDTNQNPEIQVEKVLINGQPSSFPKDNKLILNQEDKLEIKIKGEDLDNDQTHFSLIEEENPLTKIFFKIIFWLAGADLKDNEDNTADFTFQAKEELSRTFTIFAQDEYGGKDSLSFEIEVKKKPEKPEEKGELILPQSAQVKEEEILKIDIAAFTSLDLELYGEASPLIKKGSEYKVEKTAKNRWQLTFKPDFDFVEHPKTKEKVELDFELRTKLREQKILDKKTLVVLVFDVNRNPEIITEKLKEGQVNLPYSERIEAKDNDNDQLIFSMESKEEIKIDPQTGEINWLPKKEGGFKIKVKVEDKFGGEAVKEFEIKIVKELPKNQPPTIEAPEIVETYVNEEVTFTVTGKDVDNDKLSLSAMPGIAVTLEGISWQVVKDQPGEVEYKFSWIPTQPSQQKITFRISDGINPLAQKEILFVAKEKEILPEENQLPEIINFNPLIKAKINEKYQYQVEVKDKEGDKIIYQIEGPEWLKIDEKGLISGKPKKEGTFKVIVKVTDAFHLEKNKFNQKSYYLIVGKKEEGIIKFGHIYYAESVKSGEDLFVVVNFFNEGEKIEDLTLTLSLPELGVKRSLSGIKLEGEKSKFIYLTIPEETLPGEYFLKITLSSDFLSKTTYRPFEVLS